MGITEKRIPDAAIRVMCGVFFCSFAQAQEDVSDAVSSASTAASSVSMIDA